MIVIITSVIDQWKVGSLSRACYTLRGRQLELYAGMFHLILLSLFYLILSSFIFLDCAKWLLWIISRRRLIQIGKFMQEML